MKDAVDITVLVDRSGSMENIKNDMEGALREFIKNAKKTNVETRFSLAQFDTDYEMVIEAKDIQTVEEDSIKIAPRGGTALLDAFGKTIDNVGSRLAALPESDRPNKVLIISVSDGGENSSKIFTKEKIREMTKLQQETYKWEFVYFGANQDSFDESHKMGLKSSSTINFASNTRSIMSGMACLTKNYTSYVTNCKVSMDFEDEDYKQQIDLGVKQK